MSIWLRNYLTSKYSTGKVFTIDSHAFQLDKILYKYGVLKSFPYVVGLDIQIDVLGIVILKKEPKLFFIEAKVNQLNLHDLGQLWAYCQLCNPEEAYLLSPSGLGSLSKIIKTLRRTDLLDYGDSRFIKKMIVAKWNCSSNSIDATSVVN